MTVEENLSCGEVRYVDRRDGGLKTEAIYGERALRWVYGNPLGRLAQWLLVRRWIVSAWYGRKMDEVKSYLRIAPFIEKYGLDESEFAEPASEYASFNDFFYRKRNDLHAMEPEIIIENGILKRGIMQKKNLSSCRKNK